MRKLILILAVGAITFCCDFHPLYKENKTVYFSIYNIGAGEYTRIIVYAKDSLRSYADSTTPQGNLKYSDGVSLGITLTNLKNISGGIFEIQADMANGKLLRQEFGRIDGLNTRLNYRIDLKDSTILFK